jgi:hypothetical protein
MSANRNEYKELQYPANLHIRGSPGKSSYKKHRIVQSNQIPDKNNQVGFSSSFAVSKHQQEYFEYQKSLSSPDPN